MTEGGAPGDDIANGFHQVAWVVDEIRAAETFFTAKLGVPKFVHVDDVYASKTEGTYRGGPGDWAAHFSLGYAGETQIELVQHLSGHSIFRDFLERRGPGVHHTAMIVRDLDQASADLEVSGFPMVQGFRPAGARVRYFDTVPAIGVYTELIELDDEGRKFFALIKRGEF